LAEYRPQRIDGEGDLVLREAAKAEQEPALNMLVLQQA